LETNSVKPGGLKLRQINLVVPTGSDHLLLNVV